jgi:hypothetical protein
VYKFIVALWLERLSLDGVKTEAAGQGATIVIFLNNCFSGFDLILFMKS